jgi:hypothetical protein
MEFDIETWVPYRCDFKPVTTNSLFGDALGDIARMAMMLGSELLYMWNDEDCPVGALVPENLMHPNADAGPHAGFAIVFAYSEGMERVLCGMERSGGEFGAGITRCGIWKRSILLDECKVLVAASADPDFDIDRFLESLKRAMSGGAPEGCGGVPYFAEKFGYRRFSIPFETDDVTELQIGALLRQFEFEVTRRFVGLAEELSLGVSDDE